MSDRYSDVVFPAWNTRIISTAENERQVTFFTISGMQLRIEVLREDVFCFTYLPDAHTHIPHSYATQGAVLLDECDWSLTEKEEVWQIETTALICEVDKNSVRVCIRTHMGTTVHQELRSWSQVSSIHRGIQRVQMSLHLPEQAQYYGMGDKAGALQLRGQRFTHWNSDMFGYQADTDPLYRSVPFYYALHEGKATGVFLDNTYRSHFDFGKTQSDELLIEAEGGLLRYYFFYGPELAQVSTAYAQLTGTAPLPPLWALGFHQCRWSYYPQARVLEIAHRFREEQIPCDALYLDIDYMDGYRCFTWDEDKFPNPVAMIDTLKAEGFHTVVMIDPGIKVEPGYEVFKQGMEQDVFCKRADGQLMIGPVWPDDCVFPDYTDERVRIWWGNLYRTFYNEMGISGFWNDMNEPAVFRVRSLTFPPSVRHHFEGSPTHHAQIHNVYGMQMARATYEGLRNLQYDKRPFLLARAGFSGSQRYAAVWTGDNTASWEHLAIAVRQCVRLSISGFSMCGSDIGGFVEQPSGELMVRWLQLGAFHPFFRVHSIGDNEDGAAKVEKAEAEAAAFVPKVNQEPWSFGEPYTSYARNAINLRYRLMPYLYTLMWKHHQVGIPVLLPLSFYDQSDRTATIREKEFMLGAQLLVCPVLMPQRSEDVVYLPAGIWYHYFTGEVYEGNHFHRINTPLSHVPLFVKAGSVIPHCPLRQHTQESVEILILEIYFGEGRYQSELYEDAGDGYDYENGNFLQHHFEVEGANNQLRMTWERQGTYVPTYVRIELAIYGMGNVSSAYIDGNPIPCSMDENGVGHIHFSKSSFHNLELL